MPLDLNELLKKAKSKGIFSDINNPTKPWHQESVVVNLESKERAESNEKIKFGIASIRELEQTGNKNEIISGQLRDKQETIEDKTGNKRVTKRKQTGNKEETEQETNEKQTGNNKTPITHPLQQTGNKRVTKQVTEQVTENPEYGKQTGNKEVAHAPLLSTIVGVQKDIILFFYFLTKKTISCSTNPLTLDHISISLNLKKTVVKTTIIRLQKKLLISRSKSKTGRGGWTVYELNAALYKELMQQDNFGYLGNELSIKQVTNGKQTGNKGVTKEVTEQVTGEHSSSSSSSILNKTTTTETGFIDPFKIDFEPLAEIGLTENHVNQLIKQEKLTTEQIQECIDHFAFDLTHNDRAKTFKLAPLDVFMGTLRKGSYYNAPSNYESKKAINLRLSLEAKMKREQAEKELEDKLKDVEWKEWSEKLTDQELAGFYIEDKPIDAAIPEKVQKTLKRRNALNNAKQYFQSEVWPVRRKEILS